MPICGLLRCLARLSPAGFVLLGLLPGCMGEPSPQPFYDIVILDGRVIDPETGLDGVLNVAIQDGRIARITPEPVAGELEIDADGLVIAPGFIDMHSHALSLPSMRQQAFDGVTTVLELELGALPIAAAYERMAQSGAALNYGYSVSWVLARMKVMDGAELTGAPDNYLRNVAGPGWRRPANETQLAEILRLVEAGLEEGGLGTGIMLGYAPATSPEEYLALNELAARKGAPTFTHVRHSDFSGPRSVFAGLDEFIDVARLTGAAMHFCHINSSSWRHIAEVRRRIEAARAEGLRISTEAYPYGAGSTTIGAARYDPQTLQDTGLRVSDIYVTDEHRWIRDAEDLRAYRARSPASIAIFHFLNEAVEEDRALLAEALTLPGAAIASDALPYTVEGRFIGEDVWPIPDRAVAHPRAAGTFSRVVGNWVRDRKDLDLSEAIARASLFPARILETASPQFSRKGRLQEGMDADIVIFDPGQIRDRATYEMPHLPSEGVVHLIVNGEMLIFEGILDMQARPGRPLRNIDRITDRFER